MSQIEKKVDKFLQNPTSSKYKDIEQILLYFGFERIKVKGSHVKFKHAQLDSDIVIPVHNNECKVFYKELVSKKIEKIRK